MDKIRTLHSDKQTIYMGIDVHEITYRISLFHQGEEILNQSSPADYSCVKKLLKRYSKFIIHAVYEAGAFGYSLYDKLKGDGVRVIVTPPSKIPSAPGDKVKTDTRDCRKLAQLLSAGLLKAVTVPIQRVREDRELLRTRDQLVDQRRRIYQQIQSKLRFHGLSLRFRGRISSAGSHALLAIPMEQSLRCAFEHLLETYDFYTGLLKRVRKEVLAIAEKQEYLKAIKLLMSIPGVGLLTALAWVLELPSMREFECADRLASFLGFTPSESSSGDTRHQGRITRNGNAKMRWSLIQSAWILVQKDAAMGDYFDRLKHRRGAKRAIVAVARKLSARMRAVLIKQTPYALGTVL